MSKASTPTKTTKNKVENESYLALYRKYRPADFKDVIGQDLALQTIQNAIENGKISHSYIFYGDRGTGKTTMARIFARAIGSAPEDIYELDAASNRKIDDIREVIEASKVSTFGSKYKVYILDEAHMLTREAFNALLKTLEEPPAHVIFILATTDRDKLPNTIISRCQEIDFASPTIEEITKLISKVAKAENIDLEESAKKVIALEGKGSFRDTLGILEKVLNTVAKEKITLGDVEEVLGKVSEDKVLELIEALGSKNIPKLIETLASLNLNTHDSVERTYLELIRLFELAMYLKFIDTKTTKKTFQSEASDKTISRAEELAKAYPKEITSNNLYRILEIENLLKASQSLSKEILTAGLIRIIEESEIR